MGKKLGLVPRLIKAIVGIFEKAGDRFFEYLGPWTEPQPEPEPEPKRVPYDRELESKWSHNVTLRQRAAIALKIPNSGLDWLDDMIKQSRQLDLEPAKQAAKGGDAS